MAEEKKNLQKEEKALLKEEKKGSKYFPGEKVRDVLIIVIFICVCCLLFQGGYISIILFQI